MGYREEDIPNWMKNTGRYNVLSPSIALLPQEIALTHGFLFRFVQAGSEVSALLGRMPSAVGY
jgi:hypothetical protein